MNETKQTLWHRTAVVAMTTGEGEILPDNGSKGKTGSMGKHNVKKNNTPRNAAVIAAVGVGAALVSPAVASATPVTHEQTGITVDVPNEVLPHVESYFNQAGIVEQATAAVNQGLDAAGAPAAAPITSVGQAIADVAKSKIGSPYVWGAAGPNAFDCSGLTSWAYSQNGKSIPRTSSAQASSGTPVSLDALQPGDIVSYYGGASHVAIYIGNGQVVQALNESSPVRVDDLHMMPIYNAVRF